MYRVMELHKAAEIFLSLQQKSLSDKIEQAF
jgi:hypothetical protein